MHLITTIEAVVILYNKLVSICAARDGLAIRASPCCCWRLQQLRWRAGPRQPMVLLLMMWLLLLLWHSHPPGAAASDV